MTNQFNESATLVRNIVLMVLLFIASALIIWTWSGSATFTVASVIALMPSVIKIGVIKGYDWTLTANAIKSPEVPMVVVERPRVDDAKQMTKLINACVAEGTMSTYQQDIDFHCRLGNDDANHYLRVARIGGATSPLAGLIDLTLQAETETLYIERLAVEAQLRGKRLVGLSLLDAAESLARLHRCKTLRLLCMHGNTEAHAFYERALFRQTGTIQSGLFCFFEFTRQVS